jgi:hypothetical protein
MGLECLFESMKQFSVEVSRIQFFGSIGGSGWLKIIDPPSYGSALKRSRLVWVYHTLLGSTLSFNGEEVATKINVWWSRR